MQRTYFRSRRCVTAWIQFGYWPNRLVTQTNPIRSVPQVSFPWVGPSGSRVCFFDSLHYTSALHLPFLLTFQGFLRRLLFYLYLYLYFILFIHSNFFSDWQKNTRHIHIWLLKIGFTASRASLLEGNYQNRQTGWIRITFEICW